MAAHGIAVPPQLTQPAVRAWLRVEGLPSFRAVGVLLFSRGPLLPRFLNVIVVFLYLTLSTTSAGAESRVSIKRGVSSSRERGCPTRSSCPSSPSSRLKSRSPPAWGLVRSLLLPLAAHPLGVLCSWWARPPALGLQQTFPFLSELGGALLPRPPWPQRGAGSGPCFSTDGSRLLSGCSREFPLLLVFRSLVMTRLGVLVWAPQQTLIADVHFPQSQRLESGIRVRTPRPALPLCLGAGEGGSEPSGPFSQGHSSSRSPS